MFKKNFVSSLLLSSLIAFPVYANKSFNCSSNQVYFNVSVRQDSDGSWCVWRVRTGVTKPVGEYTPSVAVFHPVKFKLPNGVNYTIENCSPKSYNAQKMQYTDVTLICSFLPNGETGNRLQELLFASEDAYGNELQQYANNQWIKSGPLCEVSSEYCRVAPPL